MDLRVVALVLTALFCTGRAQLLEESKTSTPSHGVSKSSGNSVSQSLVSNYGQSSSAYGPNNNADQLKYSYYAQQTPQQQQYYSYYYPQQHSHAAAAAKPISNVISVNRESAVAADDQGRGQGWGQMDTQGQMPQMQGWGQMETQGQIPQMQGWGAGGQGTSQTKGGDGGLLNGLGNVFGNSGGGDMGGGGIFGTLTEMISNMLSLLGMDDNTNGSNNQMGYGGGDGWGQPNMMTNSGPGGAGGAGGGIGGLLGILLGKKAGIIKTKALLLLFSPIIIPLVLLVLAAIVGIVLAIPIPVYEPVGNSRSNQRVGYFGLGKSLDFAKAALESEECVERVTCEMMKTTRDFVSEDWTKRKLESIVGGWTGKLEKSVAAAKAGKSCMDFKCSNIESPFKTIQTFFLSRGPARQRIKKPKKATKTKL